MLRMKKLDYDFILVTGSSRSGTSLIARILASCQNVAFSYEPSIVGKLLGKYDSIESNIWTDLLDSFLREEILIGSICGRHLNTNRMDESSAYRYLSDYEISRRLSVSLSRAQAIEKIYETRHTVIVKWPDIVGRVKHLTEKLPEAKIAITCRNPISTISSLYQKHWFESPTSDSAASTSRFDSDYEVQGLPFWLCRRHVQWWLSATELMRTIYYYFQNVSPDFIPKSMLSYDDLLKDPSKWLDTNLPLLSLEPTKMTHNVVQTIDRSRAILVNNSLGLTFEIIKEAACQLPDDCADNAISYLEERKWLTL